METLDLTASTLDAHTRIALTDLSLGVVKSKRIIVVTGAGISCSSGIPDFRSSDGLYNLVKERYPQAVMKGKDLFCSSLFRDPTSTSVFYTFIAQLKRSIDLAHPSPTHLFLRTLDEKKRLLRSYTQNIDGFEERIGLTGSGSERARAKGKGKGKLLAKEVRNVQLHGDIHRVRCGLCSCNLPCTEEYLTMFDDGSAPNCPECTQRSEARVARSARSLKVGTLRPAIVLYDEPHPLGDDIGALHAADAGRRPDMLIVMGTSLKVHGLKALVRDFARAVRASTPASAKNQRRIVFVNKTAPPAEWSGVFDYWVKGDTDTWVERVEQDWRQRRPADWEVQQTLDAGSAPLKARKTGTNVAKVSKPAAKAGPKRPPAAVPLPESETEDEENIAPLPPSSPLTAASSAPSTPSSPSKRRSPSSHYSRSSPLSCPPSSPSGSLAFDSSDEEGEGDLQKAGADVECSPPKRRTLARKAGTAPESKRLFGDSTNAAPSAGLDVFGSPTKSVPAKGRTARSRGTSRVRPAAAANKEAKIANGKAARVGKPAPLATANGQVRMEAFVAGGPKRAR